MLSSMEKVNIHEAKNHLSQLLSCALLGEEIVMTQAGKLEEEPLQNRILGQDEGLLIVLKILTTLSQKNYCMHLKPKRVEDFCND